MRNFLLAFIATVLLITVPACNDNDEHGQGYTGGSSDEPVSLVVSTDIAASTRSTKGVISSFPANSQLGLFLTRAGNPDNIFNWYGPGENILSTYNGWHWIQEPHVLLGTEPVTVLAYYPYKSGNYNGRSIPVEHVSQTDYMYSSRDEGDQEVNRYHPEVYLTMKHALALVQFNIFKINYPYDRTIRSIEIMNSYSSIPTLYSAGTMDISTGKITNKNGAHESAIWENDGRIQVGNGPSGNEEDCARLLVMPMQKTTGYGHVSVRFDFEGEILTWVVPEGTEWKSGTKNTYTIFISGKELYVGGVFVEPWSPGIEEMHPLD